MKDLNEIKQWVKQSNLPIADKYARVGELWIDWDNAARLLEDTRSTELEERKHALISEAIQKNEKLADNAAERQVKATAEWRTREESTIAARTRANGAKLILTVLEMRHREQQSREATERAMTKL